MQKIAITLTLIMLSLVQAASANDPTPPAKAPATQAPLVAKKAWMDNIQNKLPSLLCEKDQYFMKCFSVTESECIDFNKLFVQACLNNVALALPTELNDEHSKRWGAVIGKCSLDLFEKFLSSKKQLTLSECKEVKNDDKKDDKKQEKKEPKKSNKKEEPAP